MDFFEAIGQFAWIGWLVLIAIFLAVEVVTGELTFLMLGIGGVVGLLAAILGAPVWLQIILATAAAAALLLFVRRPLLKRLRRPADPAKFNVEGLIGMHGIVSETVSTVSGQVQLSNGNRWSARVRSGPDLPPETRIAVESIGGATAYVRPLEPNE